MIDYDKKIGELERDLANLRNLKELEDIRKMGGIKHLAIRYHGVACRYNHTDGCSWHYEVSGGVHKWDGWAHAKILNKVKEL